ncbi:acylneuraminate cytidylyltransferase family protein [Saccharothrix obliqua]|uniref:acylneuraminate cytidylyltransferase family protein n=1 Tax=Saccharothrix obliqua TaxID=2861747 RepID=UPI001C5F7C80|nr:acylneuraminate cytidylyltransferase family protein [Saccharothrix obliqua]MBW4716778.1 acylneuraminate cytidylyltransferase family protein [Saccharothrix obliqua]
MTAREVVAVVTARGGSVGFPRKNVAPFLGRPLVAHAVWTARQAVSVDRVVVSTDDDVIAEAAVGEGARLVRRPPELATADSRSVDAVLHVADELALRDDTLLLLVQPTSPLRTAEDIDACVRLHGDRETGSVVQMTVVADHHPWKACVLVDGEVRPTRDWSDLEAPRQGLPEVLRPTGGAYLVGAGDLRTWRRFFVPDVVAQVVPAERAVDVDTREDLAVAAELARSLGFGSGDTRLTHPPVHEALVERRTP